MIKFIKGNIFSSYCQTIVNTVNCVGVMGAGIALEYRLKYPMMYEKYQDYCSEGLIKIGSLWLFKHNDSKWILNFPTKDHWRYPTKPEYLIKGLRKFRDTYKKKNIQSIAFPLLGTDKGNFSIDDSKNIMSEYLTDCTISVEIYEYDSSATDSDFENFRKNFNSIGYEKLNHVIKIKPTILEKVNVALSNNKINSYSSICAQKGIGIKTIESLVKYFEKNNV